MSAQRKTPLSHVWQESHCPINSLLKQIVNYLGIEENILSLEALKKSTKL